MEDELLRIESLLHFHPEEGRITFRDRRMLILEVSGLGLLRRQLILTLGRARAKALLFRFGFDLGSNDADSLRKSREFASPRHWWEAGPTLRALEGMAAVTPRKVTFDPDHRQFEVELALRNCYEAENTLRYFGPSDEPVCWTMAGTASGHASACFGSKVLFIEDQCVARGDTECVLVGKRVEDWGDRGAPLLEFLKGESVEAVIEGMKSEVEALRSEIEVRFSFENVVGRSPAMAKILELACDVARTETTVLLLGESGVGKEVLARALHYNSRRAGGPFVAVNCAAIHGTLLESELFGHEKGAFTGADKSQPGKFERAAGGTLFLDEIGDMEASTQAKVLRVLQEKEFERVGGTRICKADVRVIAATNQDLAHLIREKKFREDLYYRVAGFPIPIPPLRERPEDILPLAHHFLKLFCHQMGKPLPQFSKETEQFLTSYRWPGNVRELQNTMERAVILSRGKAITPAHLGLVPAPQAFPVMSKAEFTLPPEGLSMEDLERGLLAQAMERASGNKTAAAKLLGLSRSALRYQLKKFGLDR